MSDEAVPVREDPAPDAAVPDESVPVEDVAGAAVPPEAVPAGEPAPSPQPGASLEVEDPELPGVPLAARLEALLFASSEPLPMRRLKELLRIEDGRLVREALDRLAEDCGNERRGVRLEEGAAGFLLRTRQDLAPLVTRLGRRPEPEKLSVAALETLAIVAYRQPVLRVDIEKIRGVASGEVLRTLVERGLVRVAGRAELPGSPLYYGTTPRFLEAFGLRDLSELPRDGRAPGGASATG